MAKFKRTFKVVASFSDGKYGPYILDNIDARDFNDVVSGFLKNVEYTRTGDNPKGGKPSGISAVISESVTQDKDASDTGVAMEFCADEDMILHDLERNGLAWFREKAGVVVPDGEFAVKKGNTNVWPKDCSKMYAILGYDHAGFQRGDVVQITIVDGASCRVDPVDVSGGRFDASMNDISNREKYIPFARI